MQSQDIQTRKPLMILVSGAPGAGKTTLARKLAEYLRVPHIPRDDVFRGIKLTRGGDVNKSDAGLIPIYFGVLKHMLQADIGLVTDGTLYRGLSEKDVREQFVPIAVVINVHVRAKNEYDRFVKRESEREGWSDEWVRAHMDRLKEIYNDTVDPLDFGVPVIEVDATDGYKPAMPDIVARIRELYADLRTGIKLTT